MKTRASERGQRAAKARAGGEIIESVLAENISVKAHRVAGCVSLKRCARTTALSLRLARSSACCAASACRALRAPRSAFSSALRGQALKQRATLAWRGGAAAA